MKFLGLLFLTLISTGCQIEFNLDPPTSLPGNQKKEIGITFHDNILPALHGKFVEFSQGQFLQIPGRTHLSRSNGDKVFAGWCSELPCERIEDADFLVGTSLVLIHTQDLYALWLDQTDDWTSATSGELVIPNGEVNIGDDAFKSRSLTSLVFPDSVTTIGRGAFQSNQITDVVLSDSITEIKDGAFYSNRITSLIIPPSVKTIGQAAFSGNGLTDIVIPASIETLRDAVFIGNPLSSVIIEERDTPLVIQGGTFQGSATIENVSILDPEVTVQSGAFSSINNLRIASRNIGDTSFGYKNLKTLILEKTVTKIDSGAFQNNELTTVVIPDSVTEIGGYVFMRNKLTEIVIPNTISKIENHTFSYNELVSVLIPDTIVSIGNNAFSFNRLTSIVIPNSVTSIGSAAFSNNQLTSVAIPPSVTSIGGGAFYENPNLTTITIGAGVDLLSGSFPNNFDAFYDGNSKAAGTYHWNGGAWEYLGN